MYTIFMSDSDATTTRTVGDDIVVGVSVHRYYTPIQYAASMLIRVDHPNTYTYEVSVNSEVQRCTHR